MGLNLVEDVLPISTLQKNPGILIVGGPDIHFALDDVIPSDLATYIVSRNAVRDFRLGYFTVPAGRIVDKVGVLSDMVVIYGGGGQIFLGIDLWVDGVPLVVGGGVPIFVSSTRLTAETFWTGLSLVEGQTVEIKTTMNWDFVNQAIWIIYAQNVYYEWDPPPPTDPGSDITLYRSRPSAISLPKRDLEITRGRPSTISIPKREFDVRRSRTNRLVLPRRRHR